jgi:hypothetical protein
MTAEQFLKQFGETTDPNARFINAGNTVVIPLVELLEKYLAANEPKTKIKIKK